MADNSIETPKLPEVAAQSGALIGDEAVNAAANTVEPEVQTDSVQAQVAAQPASPPSQVYVHEVRVELDRVITDPSSPEAVQIPDAGRGSLDLPIHALGNQTPEQQLSGDSSAPADEPSPEPAPESPAPAEDEGDKS